MFRFLIQSQTHDQLQNITRKSYTQTATSTHFHQQQSQTRQDPQRLVNIFPPPPHLPLLTYHKIAAPPLPALSPLNSSLGNLFFYHLCSIKKHVSLSIGDCSVPCILILGISS
ncbi:hypothetical protein JTE90_005393 [Oedothorax gibbosus]|uniref:Uncharacterized protein n=1 Tax=Oedothorax gibbosus TaxID=931172 RepID=A0AAV6V776_9ARAC|nr:hypothetical protein JTE90_005393 [Oedothorax gibbosus]